jgi:hypothetical protein
MERIGTVHAASHGTYGSPRVHAELVESGLSISRKRVARLMKAAGLAGVSRRRFVTTTVRGGGRQAPDLVQRSFTAGVSRRIVGWSMSLTLHGDIELAALNMALSVRKPKSVIRHSDQGSQYTSIAFGNGARLVAPTASDDIGSGNWEIMPGFGVRYTFTELSSDTYFVPAMRYAVSFAGSPAKRNISEPQIAPTFILLSIRAMTSASIMEIRFRDKRGGYSFQQILRLAMRSARRSRCRLKSACRSSKITPSTTSKPSSAS